MRSPGHSARHSASAATLRRRDLLRASVAAALGAGCTTRIPHTKTPDATGARSVEVWWHFDLPAADPRSRELSGAAWDGTDRVLWCVQDETPTLVSLSPDAQIRGWRFGETIEAECKGPVDLEGIVIVPGGFVLSSEQGPRLIEVDRRGRYVRDFTLPAHIREARHNLSLESLAISPSGRYLFTTTEAALERDGALPTRQAGTRVRVLRVDRTTGETTEHAYLTDPLPFDKGDLGISDVTALDDERLLVLERSWSEGHGNTIRVYETALDERARCSGVERLTDASATLAKTLRVDLADLAAGDLPAAKQPQASPLLDNFEGMTLGPTLPHGRPSLLMVSDDNGHATQVARILVLVL